MSECRNKTERKPRSKHFCKEGAQYVIEMKGFIRHLDDYDLSKYLFMTGKDQEPTGGDGNRMAGGVPWFVNLK